MAVVKINDATSKSSAAKTSKSAMTTLEVVRYRHTGLDKVKCARKKHKLENATKTAFHSKLMEMQIVQTQAKRGAALQLFDIAFLLRVWVWKKRVEVKFLCQRHALRIFEV